MNDLERKYNTNQVIVNNKSNFKSQLVKSQAILDDIKYEELVLVAMGRATCRAMNLALQLNINNCETFQLIPRTYSVEIKESKKKRAIRGADKDGFNPDDVDIAAKRIYHAPAIEIRVRKSQLEIDKVKRALLTGKS